VFIKPDKQFIFAEIDYWKSLYGVLENPSSSSICFHIYLLFLII